MSKPSFAWPVAWFATATLVSAFLVFQVQPVISKTVLPWFGGSPAVWTTCMLFFQVLLFGGYAYAHLTTRWLTPAWQGAVHLLLLAAALLLLPITPAAAWKPSGGEHPAAAILLILLANVGLPYFVLSSTGPLIQAWFSLDARGRSPYRLYALSNVGSLAALLSYPLLVEPALTTGAQGRLWSLGFCLFALVCGYLAARLWRLAERAPAPPAAAADEDVCRDDAVGERTSWRGYAAWLLLPALASIMLLATTNHVCQDVAVIPFLWVAPLSLYLLTFIICFDRQRWYSRRWTAGLAVVSVVALCLLLEFRFAGRLLLEVAAYFTTMFLVCMVCHGELVRSKPHPRQLTLFYLLVSAGGALGGIVVALVCPLVFRTHLEMNLGLIAGAVLALGAFWLDARRSWLGDSSKRRLIAGLGCAAVLLLVGLVQLEFLNIDTVLTRRNFYGVLHVKQLPGERGKMLVHGSTVHGAQIDHPRLKRMPTTYYADESGVGLALRRLRGPRPLRVGAVGLGTGTVAAYGRSGDYFRFYEINPAVVEIARTHFSFLADCPAEVDVVLGDARLSLEREPPQRFDVLVLDAFSSDSIPTHLLTREAFQVYRRHLRADGVIAIHVSNRSLRLPPVVLRLAEHFGMPCVEVRNGVDGMRVVLAAQWMLMTDNQDFLTDEQVHRVAWRFRRQAGQTFPLWTDQYNNLIQILKVF